MVFNRMTEDDKGYIASIVSGDRFSSGESNLKLHSRDMSGHRASLPEAVVWPKDREEVSRILSYANSRLIPVTPWGAGTSLEGNPIPLYGGIVMDMTRMDRILEVRATDFQVDVEPGVIYREVNQQLKNTGLFFPPDPGADATIGGMIGNNASGIRTLRYGSTKDNVLRLVVVLANGEVIEVGTRAAKTSSGLDLLHLFIGSEGMLGVVVEATLRLASIPAEIASAVAAFETVEAAGIAVSEVMRNGIEPAALELLAPECLGLMNRHRGLGLPIAPSIFLEFHGATKGQLAESMDIAEEICREQGCILFKAGLERGKRDLLLEARYALGEMIRQDHPDRLRISIDVAVPISAYPEMISFARKLAAQSGAQAAYVFGHAGDGNVHLVIEADRGDRTTWERIKEVNLLIVHKALTLKGTVTGEHGVGIGKVGFMEAEHGMTLAWMKKIKELFDPNGILNPGKIFPA